MRICKLFCVVVSFVTATTAFAYDESDLSLSSILDLPVVVATKKKESVSNAPAIVTAYGAKDIDRYGYYTLEELATITPGFFGRRDGADDGYFETRGVVATQNEKHLVLVDGIPINHPRNNMAPIGTDLPLFFADRVEFLRGPASALYGTGAFNGVVNIVSKDEAYQGSGGEFKATYGLEPSTKNEVGTRPVTRRVMGNTWSKKEGFSSVANLGYFDRDASDAMVGGGRNTFFRDQEKSFFGRYSMQLGDFRVGTIFMNRTTGYGSAWGGIANASNYHRWTEFIPYVRYTTTLAPKLTFNSYFKFNLGTEEGAQANSLGWYNPAGTIGHFAFDVPSKQYEALAEATYAVSNDTNLIAGVNYDRRNQDPSSWVQQQYLPADTVMRLYDRAFQNIGIYAQATQHFAVLSGLTAIAGARADFGSMLDPGRPDAHFSQLSPRIGFVQKLTESLNFKALYGSAFNAPMHDHYSHNDEKASQIPSDRGDRLNLKPESIRSLETSLTYTTTRAVATFVAFANSTKNALERQQWEPALTDWWENNPGITHTYGYEADLRVLPAQDLYLGLNYSYALPKDVNGVPLIDTPVHKGAFTGGYRLGATSLGAAVRRISAWRNTLSGFTVADVKLGYDFSKYAQMDLQILNLNNATQEFNQGAAVGRERTFLLSANLSI